MGIKKRNSSKRIQVVVSDEEYIQIKNAAESVGLSNSAYLRELGLGYAPASVYDLDIVGELIKISADQGRFGGLIKMWLTNDERLARFDHASLSKALLNIIEKVQVIQNEILEIIKSRRILAAKKRY